MKRMLWRLWGKTKIAIFGQPVYERYYTITTPSKLPPDPRIRRRASGKAALAWILLAPVALIGANAVILSYPAANAALGGWQVVTNPFNLLVWVVSSFLPFNPHTPTPAVHAAVTAGLQAATWGLVIVSLFATAVYTSNLSDTTDLTTEHGDSAWMYPEKLASLEHPLLPADYDIYAGFVGHANRRRHASAHHILGQKKARAQTIAAEREHQQHVAAAVRTNDEAAPAPLTLPPELRGGLS